MPSVTELEKGSAVIEAEKNPAPHHASFGNVPAHNAHQTESTKHGVSAEEVYLDHHMYTDASGMTLPPGPTV